MPRLIKKLRQNIRVMKAVLREHRNQSTTEVDSRYFLDNRNNPFISVNQQQEIFFTRRTNTGLENLGIEHESTKVNYGPERTGDVKHSLADISKASNLIGYKPLFSFSEGIKQAIVWYSNKNSYWGSHFIMPFFHLIDKKKIRQKKGHCRSQENHRHLGTKNHLRWNDKNCSQQNIEIV